MTSALLLSACGTPERTTGNGPEKTRLNVAGLAVVDDAPLYIAAAKGLFKKEGLDVHVTTLTQSTQAIPGLLRGDIDIDLGGNYVSFLQAAAKGAIKLRILADGFHCAPNVVPVLTMPGSRLRRPADLKGRKIAVNIPNNVQSMLVDAVLRSRGVDVSTIRYVQVPFPDMAAALQKGQVDAASAVQPFASAQRRTLHARKVVDSCTGPTKHVPLSGAFATEEFVRKNPKTVAAFQRAYRAAARMAANRALVVRTLPTYTKINASAAKGIAFGTYPTTLSAAPIQRVADLMRADHLLTSRLEVAPMIVNG
jgi:NitT/TauT family transport system substrate-binding protein